MQPADPERTEETIMNRKFALALVLSVAGAAQADDPTPEPPQFISAHSRADVIAELQQFRRSGIDPWAQDYNPIAAFHGSRSRASVRDEYIAARGAVAALNGEDSGSMYLAQSRTAHPQATQIAATGAATE
jgi:hypothetical protein